MYIAGVDVQQIAKRTIHGIVLKLMFKNMQCSPCKILLGVYVKDMIRHKKAKIKLFDATFSFFLHLIGIECNVKSRNRLTMSTFYFLLAAFSAHNNDLEASINETWNLISTQGGFSTTPAYKPIAVTPVRNMLKIDHEVA